MLRARQLEVTFNPGTPLENRALRGLDLEIPKGQFVTVIGSNGAGKSTLLNAISGDLLATAAGSASTASTSRAGRRGSAPAWSRACSRTRWPAPARR